MPSKPPSVNGNSIAQLQALGAQIRSQRKALRLNATVTAEAAGVSRVTLHRIEKGEPSVTIGAWCNALAALGMTLQASVGQGGQAYGPSVARDLGKAIDRLQHRAGWLERCMQVMAVEITKAVLWQKVRALRRIVPEA